MGSVGVHIYGDGQAADLAARLIRAGDGALKQRLYDAIRDANAGLEGRIRRSALTHLPKRNGLAARVAASRISIRRAFSDSDGVGIHVHVSNEYDIGGLNDGLNIHPLFGNKLHWYPQHVRAGWFDDAMDGVEMRTRKFIDRAAERFAQSL